MPLRQVTWFSVLFVLNTCGMPWCGTAGTTRRGRTGQAGEVTGAGQRRSVGRGGQVYGNWWGQVGLCCVHVLCLHTALVGVSP